MKKVLCFSLAVIFAAILFFSCNDEEAKDPTASFTVSPEKEVYEDGDEITFTDASVANSGDITQWLWEFGDGEKATTKVAKHTYKAANTYTVKLTVVNSGGKQGTATKQIKQKGANQAPVANFVIKVGDKTQGWALAGDEVTFENTSTDPDEGDELTYAWDFGDGNTSTDKSPKHTYAAVTTNMNYTIKVVATDKKGATNEKTATLQLRLIAPQEGFNVIASYEMGDTIFLASPAVDANAVYMTSNAGKLVALGKNDLTQKWEFDVKNTNSLGLTTQQYRQASSPAIASDGTIYIGTGHASTGTQLTAGYLYAVTTAGTKKWEYAFHSGAYVNYASPAIDGDGNIYIGGRGTNGPLMKVNKDDGTEVWKIAPGGGLVGMVTIDVTNQKLYVACGGNGIRRYSYAATPTNTSEINRRLGASIYNSGQITLNPAENVFYVCAKDANDASTGIIAAFPTTTTGNASGDYTKDMMWSFSTEGNPEKMGVSISADGKTLYAGAFDHNAAGKSGKGKLYAINATDGTQKWSYETEGLVGSIPAVDAEGNIHFGDQKGYYYVLTPDGTEKYKQALAAEVGTQSFIYSSPVIDTNGDVYVGVGTKLVKLSTGVLGYPSASPWPMKGQNNFRTGAK